MTDLASPENINTLATSITNNGISNTLIATIIIIAIVLISTFIGIFTLTLRASSKTTDKLLSYFEENQKKDRDIQISKFSEISEHIKTIGVEMKNLGQQYNNTIENVSCLVELNSKKTIEAVINDKPQSLRDFEKQSKQIIKSTVYESIDFVLEIVAKNSLFNNKSNITQEIHLKFQQHLQDGADYIDALPFRDTEVKQKLFLRAEDFMKESYLAIIKILDVKENYDRFCLERGIRSVREDFINKINSLRYTEL